MEHTGPTLTKKQIIDLAFQHVYTDVEAFRKDIAKEHCIANMGQELGDFVDGHFKDPARVISWAYNAFYQQSESDEMAEGIDEEMRSWLKEADKQIKAVQKKGLPLTMENARLAFEKKGPFAKKTK